MELKEIIKYAGVFLFLVICSIQDVKEKKISIKKLVIFGMIFLAMSFLWGNLSWQERGYNMLPGIMALLISFLTKEQLGYGDGICLLIMGCVLSGALLLGTVMISLILSSAFGLLLLIGKKAERKTRLPFLPFLAAGYVIQLVRYVDFAV